MPQESFTLSARFLKLVNAAVEDRRKADDQYSKAAFYREAVEQYLQLLGFWPISNVSGRKRKMVRALVAEFERKLISTLEEGDDGMPRQGRLFE